MEDGTTAYNVTYQDGVTVVSKDETMRHLISIRRDGNYVFDSSASQIANLEPGSVLLLSGLALCTVVDVKRLPTVTCSRQDQPRLPMPSKTAGWRASISQDAQEIFMQEWLPDSLLSALSMLPVPNDQCAGAADFDVDFCRLQLPCQIHTRK